MIEAWSWRKMYNSIISMNCLMYNFAIHTVNITIGDLTTTQIHFLNFFLWSCQNCYSKQ